VTDEWGDVDDEWTETIRVAHPSRNGAHNAWGVAMQMVGHRHSKGALVALVHWLLVERDGARRAAAGSALDTKRLDAACTAAWELALTLLESETTRVFDPERVTLWPGSPENVATLLKAHGFSSELTQMADGRTCIVIDDHPREGTPNR
jgi:hypothetical protein